MKSRLVAGAAALVAAVAGLGQLTPAAAAPARALGPACQQIALNPGAFVGFAKLDGITGDATAKDHAHEIDLTALRFCVIRPPGVRALLGDIVLGKNIDSATPQLLNATEQNRLINNATIALEKADSQTPFLTIELTGVHVVDSVVNEEKTGTGEEVQLTAGRLRVTFSEGDRSTTSCFDFVRSTPC